MKAFSIISLVVFVLALVSLGANTGSADDLLGTASVASLLGIALSITNLVAMRKRVQGVSGTHELEKLFELKQKGVLTEDEYNTKKSEVLAG